MQTTLNRRLLTTIFILLLLITCIGCQKDESYLVVEWLNDITLQAGFEVQSNKDALQELEKYGVFKADELNLDEPLTYEIMADTLANLIDEDALYSENYIIDESPYLHAIQNIIALKIYQDDAEHFKSQSKVSREEALKVLKRAVQYINERHFSKTTNYRFKEDLQKLNEDLNIDDLSLGTYVINDQQELYVVEEGPSGHTLKRVPLIEGIETLEISDDQALNFDEAYLEDIYISKNCPSVYQDENIKRKAFKFTDAHHVEFDDYQLSYYLTKHGIHLYLSKQNDHGLNFYWDSEINNVKPTYQWKYTNQQLEKAYFKLACNINQSIGFKRANYANLYGDLTNFDPLKLGQLFKKANDVVDKEVTLFKIHVPIEGVPTAEIVLAVKLDFYISGRTEVVLDSNHEWGFEVRNGALRAINENSEDLDVILGANASASLGLDALLRAASTNLMNIGGRAGVKGEVKTTLHAYDSQGYLISQPSDIDYDFIEQISNETGKPIRVCADVSLYWLLDVDLNEEKTMAGRLGLGKTWHLLSNKNQIFNNLTHLENGVFKEKCSYLDREGQSKPPSIIESDQILLDSYAIVLKKRHQIKIKGLPKGYTVNDLCYRSDDEGVATVNNEGLIHRVKPGVTQIKIQTRDHRFTVSMNVLVSDLNE